MGRERLFWAVILMALIASGVLVGRYLVGRTCDATADEFRIWLWESRGLDLIAQVGLILAGALGTAALLPRDRGDMT